MINWIVKLIMKFWGLPDDLLENPEIITPHGYGLISSTELPDASQKIILEASKIAKEFPETRIVFASSNYFWEGHQEQEDNARLSLLVENGVSRERIVITEGISNTVQEVLAVLSKLRELGYNNKEIVVIVDQVHARSSKLIWEKLIPEAKIKIRSIKGLWDYRHPSLFQKSEARWLLVNILRHLSFMVFGKRIANLHHIIRSYKS